MPLAQEFLVASFNRKKELYPFWADIVKSYTLRNMSTPSDRLTALSGLAAKYLSANASDRYLAGIWAKNLAEGLAWMVKKSIRDKRLEDDHRAPKLPSWSWAALPLQTAIETNVESAYSTYFKLVPDIDDEALLDYGRVEEAVEKGGRTERICVTGRVRNLWESSSRYVDWFEISHASRGNETYTFAANPQQNT
ncbi:hypothetical protein E8E12_002544 [Didymella heteroderae]|uniref:Uncharacterized protein n=1 Tax=Didymella heteroderae TaxID=1769908 RepID=A0A9P4X0L4_9PLEO|nr:hypothetical protein E8E12_002544 [Didymella heteroderae]